MTQEDRIKLTEHAMKILLLSIRGMEPVNPALMKYLNDDLDQLRDHIKFNDGYTPLIITINSDTYVLDMRGFIEDPISPLFELTQLKINANGKL